MASDLGPNRQHPHWFGCTRSRNNDRDNLIHTNFAGCASRNWSNDDSLESDETFLYEEGVFLEDLSHGKDDVVLETPMVYL